LVEGARGLGGPLARRKADGRTPMAGKRDGRTRAPPKWASYYRWTARRRPRELLVLTLNHIEWEKKDRRAGTAVDLGFGAGNETLELLRRGWKVVAIDGQYSAAKFLNERVAPRYRSSLTTVVAPFEDLDVPPADLVHASFSLPMCRPEKFPALWRSIRGAVRPGGHFAGELFGDRDAWRTNPELNFHSIERVRELSRGFKTELLREVSEYGMSFGGPKNWHYFDLVLGKAPMRSHILH
jgi:tellurite methyltransferase